MLAQAISPSLNTLEDLGAPDFAKQELGSVITLSLRYVFAFAGALLFLYLLFGGFQLMTSMGEPKAIQGAKDKITNAFVGFLILLVAFWIVQIIATVFNLAPILNIF